MDHKIIIAFEAAGFLLVILFLIPWIQSKQRRSVDSAVKEALKERPGFEKERELLEGLELVNFRMTKLSYLTKIMSVTEFFFFMILASILLNKSENLVYGIQSYFTFFGGWLGIKTLANYGQWDHPIAGKAYFYIFLFGTFLNISTSFILALLIFNGN